MIINNAIYQDGVRVATPVSLEETTELKDSLRGMAWIGLYRPSAEEFSAVAEEFGLPELAVEDAVQAHQRPKLERYGSIVFVVLRSAHYVDPHEIIDFGEIHLFLGSDFVISSSAWRLSQISSRCAVDLKENPQLAWPGAAGSALRDHGSGCGRVPSVVTRASSMTSTKSRAKCSVASRMSPSAPIR